MRLDEIAESNTLYLDVSHGFERKNVVKVAAKHNIEVYDFGSGLKPMAFGVDPDSLAAEQFKDKLNTWGYTFRDVTSLWSTKANVLQHIGEAEGNGERYNIIVASKLGRYADYKNLPYDEAKQTLNRTVGDYHSDMFQDNPNTTVDWHENGMGARVIDPDRKVAIFFFMELAGPKA